MRMSLKLRRKIETYVAGQYGVHAPFPSTRVTDRWLKWKGGRAKPYIKAPSPYKGWEHIAAFHDDEIYNLAFQDYLKR
jgi:hypothetical protein